MATREKSFSYFLDPEDRIALRSSFTIKNGVIEKFSVQLEFENQIVLRFDNAHGYTHQHTFTPEGESAIRKLKFANLNEAYNYCYQYTKLNWYEIVGRFRKI
ncbi:MAG TPA: hypothetical protein VIH52_01615 [Candidatus Nanoarchaeia archaeon]